VPGECPDAGGIGNLFLQGVSTSQAPDASTLLSSSSRRWRERSSRISFAGSDRHAMEQLLHIEHSSGH
jgi:hypothetical protein